MATIGNVLQRIGRRALGLEDYVGFSDIPRKRVGYSEKGTSGGQQFAGRYQERYMASLQGPEGLTKMATIMRKEPAAFTAHKAVLLTAKGAIWKAVPAQSTPADREAAEFLDQCLDDMTHSFWRDVQFALSAQAYGFADLEIVWKRRLGAQSSRRHHRSLYGDGRVGIRKLAPRRQETVERWDIDEHGGHQALIQRHPQTYEEVVIPISKLLHFIGGDDRGSWEGLGWLESAYKLYHMIENYEIIEGVGHQRSFVGLPVFKYLRKPKDEDKSMVESLGEELVANESQYVSFPKPLLEFDLLTIANPNASELRQKINQLRWEMCALAMVSFIRLGTTASGSRALSEPLIEMFIRGVDAALDEIADVCNRHLVPRLFANNPGEFQDITGYPHVEHSAVKRPSLAVLGWIQGIQEFMDNALRNGIPEDNMWMRNLIGMPQIDLRGRPMPEQREKARPAGREKDDGTTERQGDETEE